MSEKTCVQALGKQGGGPGRSTRRKGKKTAKKCALIDRGNMRGNCGKERANRRAEKESAARRWGVAPIGGERGYGRAEEVRSGATGSRRAPLRTRFCAPREAERGESRNEDEMDANWKRGAARRGCTGVESMRRVRRQRRVSGAENAHRKRMGGERSGGEEKGTLRRQASGAGSRTDAEGDKLVRPRAPGGR